MGAWDAGSFQNDTALDWAGSLCESGDIVRVRTTLSRAMQPQPPQQPSFIGRLIGRQPLKAQLDARAASQAIAAAEIVAFWLGNPDQLFPDDLRAWASRHADSFSPELVALARQAVSAIKTESALKDLWEEGDGIVAPKWHKAIADLERRLQSSDT
jgi:hypothetical protein